MIYLEKFCPSLSTLTTLKPELGGRAMLSITGFTDIVALLSALLVRGLGVLFMH